MRVYLGADHRGLELKNRIHQWLTDQTIESQDLGAHQLIPDDDFNGYAVQVSEKVLADPDSFGILFCASAQGMCMQANRFKGIRAAFCRNPAEAAETRSHNDANILCISTDEADSNTEDTITAFLKTDFLAVDRYIRRNQKLDEQPS